MSGATGLRRGAGHVGQGLEEGGRQNGRREGEEVQRDEKDFVEGAEEEEDRLIVFSAYVWELEYQGFAYLVIVVEIQKSAPALINLLVTLARSSHGQGRVHVHVMARQIETDEALE